jgi:CRISPR-associated endonuclease/helicase Cas3
VTDLTPEDFHAFFRAIHGKDPFPWQARLVRDVLTTGWPGTIDLPTASGKTAVLDVATFALAYQAILPAAQRTVPRRIALVVDRRIVVDDANQRALRIATAINDATAGVLKQVRDRLASLGGEQPLATALLRGGIYREDRWARTPAQPVLLCSTVDQVGSRLLFRGYGLSNHAWPIHAGLMGNDCLIVLDEAHCSRPFLQTLDWIAKYRNKAEKPLMSPFAVVAMTATPRDDRPRFSLTDDDRAHPVLKRRIEASKCIDLRIADGKKDDDLVKALVQAAAPLDQIQPGRFVLTVVNRVATARAVHQALWTRTRAKKDPLEADIILLTGRCRGVERDALLRKHHHRMMAGRDRSTHATERALIVVATQCVEVGADLDADALVTECCPLDALRQRLGRLDRLGELGTTTATVVCRADQVWDGKGDPPDDAIYGTALSRTWYWLKGSGDDAQHIADGGIASLAGRLPTDLSTLTTAPVNAPIIFPAYCDLWAQTGPEPAVSPEPTVFLHGPRQGEPEVQIVWRADLGNDPRTWIDTVTLCPPVAGETLSLPMSAAKRWLARVDPDANRLADISAPEAEVLAKSKEALQTPRPALRWRGPERSSIALTPEDIRPGDVLVVPAVDGCDEFGWDPAHEGPVNDVADVARNAGRRAPVVRLHPSLLETYWTGAVKEIAAWTDDQAWPEDCKNRIAVAIASLPKDHPAQAVIETKPSGPRLRRGSIAEPHPSGTGVVIIGRAGWATDAADFTDEDDSSSQAPHPLGLRRHLGDVERWAGTLGTSAGLSADLIADLALAGKLHDLGKADPRFQALLHGGDPIAARRGELLAKSARMLTGKAASQARERSGYPDGGRHELLSLRLADSHPNVLAQAKDQDLVRHLVASHHGRCRPFAPVVTDERSLTVTFDLDGQAMSASSATGLEHLGSGVCERFWVLTRRYGWWGLAYLEACLRLADHRASEEAEQGDAS